MSENLLDQLKRLLAADSRLQLMERTWKDGDVIYVHVAPTSPVRTGGVESRLVWLNSLLDSLVRVYDDIKLEPGKLMFRVENEIVHFGQIVFDTVVICVHPTVQIAEQKLGVGTGQTVPLRVRVSDL